MAGLRVARNKIYKIKPGTSGSKAVLTGFVGVRTEELASNGKMYRVATGSLWYVWHIGSSGAQQML